MMKIPVTNCCGCTACASICPVNAIEMRPDEEGFLYPQVNAQRCISCGKCERVCPILQKLETDGTIEQAYALRTRSKEDLKISTSGGFTKPVAKWVFENGGVFCGATYDDDWRVYHACFESLGEEFDKTLGSKYVQSDVQSVFSQIKLILDEGRWVCFVGTTCQVYALKNYLMDDYEKLVTIDLVCHGTPSPKLWKKYIEYQEVKYDAKIKDINFRYKTYGYHSGTMRILFDNGAEYTASARTDLFLKCFFSEIASRPSCYQCVFKTKKRASDFTIFDCWSMEKLVRKQRDDDRGYTNVLIQSPKARMIFEKIRDEYFAYAVDVDRTVRYDGLMVERSAKPHPLRYMFYDGLETDDMRDHVQKYLPISSWDYLLERIKGLLYRLGMLKLFRKIKCTCRDTVCRCNRKLISDK